MITSRKCLAIILARGGSKRVPGKNLRELVGLPMIAWPVKAAISSGLFEAVIVSTDDEAIRETAIAHGAEAPFLRPPELAGDDVPSRMAEIHAIREMASRLGDFDAICSMTGTSAFVGADDLQRGLEALETGNWEFAVSVVSYPHPPQRALCVRKDGSMGMAYEEFATARTQDLEARFHDAGQFYWGRQAAFLSGKSSLAARSTPVVLARSQVVDIDTPEDWLIAEAVKQQSQSPCHPPQAVTLCIRADASQVIGSGHVLRMLALAQGWKRRGRRVILLSHNLPEALHNRWGAIADQIVNINAPAGGHEDGVQTLEAVRRAEPSAMVVDGYHFSADFHEAISQRKCPLMVVDDGKRSGARLCDLLLDQNVQASPKEYANLQVARKLLGTQYLLLREEFSAARECPRPLNTMSQHILLTLGGGDTGELLCDLAESLACSLPPDSLVFVARGVGSSLPRSLPSGAGMPVFRDLLDVQDMGELMSSCTMAVSAAGGALHELNFLGVPTVLIVLADNQVAGAQQAEADHRALVAWDGAAEASLLVTRLLNNPAEAERLAQNGRAECDGKGVDRVVEALLSVCRERKYA